MKIQQFVVDAFTDQQFGGNPAAVCLLQENIPSESMQQIASENALPETAFVLFDGPPEHLHREQSFWSSE